MAEPIIVETPAGQRRRLAALGVIMTAVSAFLMPPAELVKTMRRLQRAAQRRAPGEGTGRRA